MRFPFSKAIAVLVIALFTGACVASSLGSSLEAESDRSASGWDPFAPLIQLTPLEQALSTAPSVQSGSYAVTALDKHNEPDLTALSALRLSLIDNELQISAAGELEAAALYLHFDPAQEHIAEVEFPQDDCVTLAVEMEGGWHAIGVTGVNGAPLGCRQPLAVVRFAAGAQQPVRRAAITQDYRSAVRDLAAAQGGPGEGVTLNWSERHTGDYDLNGEVNVADLTQIGINFRVTYDTEHEDYAKLEVVDGDENFEINIADLTPIGLNFQSWISGYNVYRTPLTSPDEDPDPEESGRWSKVENPSEPSGPSAPRQFNDQDVRLTYTFQDDPGEGDFAWIVLPVDVRVDPHEEGPYSEVAKLTVGPPPALLSFENIEFPAGKVEVGDEFHIAVHVTDVTGLFSANVRFEYDNDLVELVDDQPTAEDGDPISAFASITGYDNLLEPPLFIAYNDTLEVVDPFIQLGFNATQTQGTAVKDGEGYLGFVQFRVIGTGENSECFRFPASSNFIFLWGEQYGVPIANPLLGDALSLNVQ